MIPNTLHLISGDKEIVDEAQIRNFLTKTSQSLSNTDTKSESTLDDQIIKNHGLCYHTVCIVGGQSSGKSTLLNYLFDTSFFTMDENQIKGQTTRGAFFSVSSNQLFNSQSYSDNKEGLSSPLLILDFEGTDGMERGEDQSFERQLSLFALCTADILILNMWAVDVGRYNAANMSLLRSIFELNLELFSHDNEVMSREKITLLIILRDFTEPLLLHSIMSLESSLEKIWDAVTKPENLNDIKIHDVFSIQFRALPHYRLQRTEFLEAIQKLRNNFFDSFNEEYLFSSSNNLHHVPLEDLPSYFSNCWKTILFNKDINIPSQRIMLAHHRCREALSNVQETITEKMKVLFDIQNLEMLCHLEEKLDSVTDEARSVFLTDVKLYDYEIVQEHTKELDKWISSSRFKVRKHIAASIATTVARQFEHNMSKILEKAIKGLQKGVSLCNFSRATEETKVNLSVIQSNIWDYWGTIANELNIIIASLTDESNLDLYGPYSAYLKGSPDTAHIVYNEVVNKIFDLATLFMRSVSSNAILSIQKCFDYMLTHNLQSGTTKIWTSEQALLEAYPTAYIGGLFLLNALFYLRFDILTGNDSIPKVAVRRSLFEDAFFIDIYFGDSPPIYPAIPISSNSLEMVDTTSTFDSSQTKLGLNSNDDSAISRKNILLSAEAAQYIFESYLNGCQYHLQLQTRAIVQRSSSIPLWVWILLLPFGWSGIRYILSSPLLFLLLITVFMLFFHQQLTQWFQQMDRNRNQPWVIGLKYIITLIQGIFQKLTNNSSESSPANRSEQSSANRFALNS